MSFWQISLDVSAISDDLRSRLLDGVGGAAANYVAVVFVIDFLPRANTALDALLNCGSLPPAVGADHRQTTTMGIWEAFDGFIRAVPAMDGLDPVTSELVAPPRRPTAPVPPVPVAPQPTGTAGGCRRALLWGH